MPESHDPVEVLRELAAVADHLAAALNPGGRSALLDSIAAAGQALLDGAACSVALLDDTHQELVFSAAAGAGAAGVLRQRVPINRGIAGWAVSSGQAIFVDEVTHDPRFARDVAEATGYVPTSILAAPLQTERQSLGVISVLDPLIEAAGGARQMEILTSYADPAALAIEQVRRSHDMGRMLLDALTSAADGRGLRSALRASADNDDGPQAELAQLAAHFAELGQLGTAEREAAAGLVESFLAYVRSRPDRP